jgi:hypothetical protein
LMEAAGIEPASPPPKGDARKVVIQTPSETLAQSLSRETPIDTYLARLVDAWPTLPEAVRAGIVAMVKVATERR